MKIIFMGTPDFAVPCLEKLVESGHDVALVVTQSDKPKGRGRELAPPPVKACALAHGIEVYQPLRMKDEGVLEKLSSYHPELIVVAAYGKILPESILKLPRYGCINVHGSLLPKYRGAAPIQWSVINGDKKTGITTMQMNSGLDTGDILLTCQREISQEMTSGELYDLLCEDGANLLLETIQQLQNGTLRAVPQNDEEACYAPMLDKTLSRIDWNKTADQIHNQIRGLNPWPVACCMYQGKKLKVYKSRVTEACEGTKGCIGKLNPFTVSCGDNTGLEIIEVQAENGKRMAIQDYLRGHPMQIGDVLQ